MSEYNSSASKGFMEYTKKEALQRHGKVWSTLYQALSTEDAVYNVKKKLETLKGTEILLNASPIEKNAPETDKENDSFIGMPDLNLDGLFTLPLDSKEVLTDSSKDKKQRYTQETSSNSRHSTQRTSKLVISDSDDTQEDTAEYDSTPIESDETLSSDQLTEDLSEASSRHTEREETVFQKEENLFEEVPAEETGLEFNPSGVKKVKTAQNFKWMN
ncbi:hypothetical protein NEMIN01_1311 [Nematocida minor]|uniref:uncharacterized protein n=1 Tax=Nematocida minor TaxID=1912983 RepID=UPI00221F822C|nr:uncharacterized protein NEMIN01_1311 [Nematocida minor]KAI5190978.1 hypothetical protein NEMIN01_1311 [Nematocida minor]